MKDNLVRIMRARNLNANQLGVRAGVPSGHLAQILTGKIENPGVEVLEKLSDVLQTSIDEIVRGRPYAEGSAARTSTVREVDEPRDVHAVSVPVEAVVVGGNPTEAVEAQEEDYYLLRHLYRPWRKVIRLYGESMYPTYHSGDLLLVDPKEKTRDGEVAVVKVNGDTTVKRVYGPKRGKFVLRADNPTFPPIIAEDGDEVEIVGRVIRIVDGERE